MALILRAGVLTLKLHEQWRRIEGERLSIAIKEDRICVDLVGFPFSSSPRLFF